MERNLDQWPFPDRESLKLDFVESMPLDVPCVLSLERFTTSTKGSSGRGLHSTSWTSSSISNDLFRLQVVAGLQKERRGVGGRCLISPWPRRARSRRALRRRYGSSLVRCVQKRKGALEVNGERIATDLDGAIRSPANWNRGTHWPRGGLEPHATSVRSASLALSRLS